jgi:hypothetical protein
MRRYLFLFVLSAISSSLAAQSYKLYGRITNRNLEPLAFVSVQVKSTSLGILSKEDGTYELHLDEGQYEIVYSMIGYVGKTISLVVNRNEAQNVILEESSKDLQEVVVKGTAKDRATDIIRQVIQHKEQIQGAAGAYSCAVYIRAVQEDSTFRPKATKKRGGDTAAVTNPNADLLRMAMAEISLRLDYENDQHQKEERLGVKQRGKSTQLFFLSTTEGNFDLYNNLVKVPALSTLPFVSPVSYSGLMAYQFKTLRTQQNGKYKTYTIAVKPRKLSNATVEGELTITDSSWAIVHTRLKLPAYHLPEYDFFEVEQHFRVVDQKAWMLHRQQFTYSTKAAKKKLSGHTVVNYADYELNKTFPKRHFGPELSATTLEAYKRDSTFWTTARTEPLSEKEIRFIHYSDSVYRATHSKQYLDSIDRLTNKVTWKKIAFSGQIIYDREKERTWRLPPVLSLYQPIGFGGTRINPSLFYAKTQASRRAMDLYANLSFGLRNKDLNGNIRFNRMYNPFNRGFYRVGAGRDFQYIYAGDAWINMLKRSNIYLNNFISVGHGLELVNGLFFYSDLDIAFRRSVSSYKTGTVIDSLFGNVLDNNQAVPFESYNAVYGKVRLQYTPRQRYIREALEKVILGSAWPTFYITWRKGVPVILNSPIDFDYLEWGMEQEIHTGLTGVMRYNVKTGSFLNRKDLRLVDYQFQRRGDPVLFLNPNEAFQALDSTFAVFKPFYQAHLTHEFNGFILNKIPLLKKLQLREVGGGGFLIAPERDLRYAELFTGVERVFKWPFNPMAKFKLGVYAVGSVANKFSNPVQIKVGITTWDLQRNRWY